MWWYLWEKLIQYSEIDMIRKLISRRKLTDTQRFVRWLAAWRAGCGQAARPDFCEGRTTVRGASTRPIKFLCRSDTEEDTVKFFADYKRVGRGTAPSKANAARSGRYDRDITIESGEIWKQNKNPDIGCIGKIYSSIGKANRASVKWWRMKSQRDFISWI